MSVFNKYLKNKNKGFTLIEMLIVVSTIALLASSIVIAINPMQQFEEAQDRQRETHLNSILGAVEQKLISERGWQDCEDLPDGPNPEEVSQSEYSPEFKYIGEQEGENFYDLYNCISPNYLSEKLYDPVDGTVENTQYQIWQNPYSKRVTVKYVKEDGTEIVAGPANYQTLGIPEVATNEPNDVSYDYIDIGGEIISEGDSSVFERGLVWGESELPTITDNRTTNGSGEGEFSDVINNLDPNTEYFIRAYGRNDVGIGYGVERAITTDPLQPVIETLEATNVVDQAATIQGEVISVGVGDPDVYFEWGTDESSLGNVEDIGSLGEEIFQADLLDLSLGETYYFRACGSNDSGEDCGEIKSFETEKGPPRVETHDPADIDSSSADLRGEVTSSGGYTITEKGVCYSTHGEPGKSDNCKTTTQSDTFSITFDQLDPGTDYYVRAYAENEEGTGWGDTVNFYTPTAPPEITLSPVENITGTSATTGGEVLSEGGGNVSQRGVCWSQSSAPDLTDNCTDDGSGDGEFTSQIDDLSGGTIYYVRAYAENEDAVSYSDEVQFETTVSPPSLTTLTPYNISSESATSGGSQLEDGGDSVTSKGICWSYSGTPVYEEDDCLPYEEGGLDDYTIDMTDLSPGTTYYVRAYAENSEGVGYGKTEEFSTNLTLPELSTVVPTEVDHNSAITGGDISFDGGGEVTEKGICYSTSTGPRLDDTASTCNTEGTGSSDFTTEIANLDPETKYYVRAYATNDLGTSYGQEESFNTTSPVEPTISTNEVTEISHYEATSGGVITDDGGRDVQQKGVCWSSSNKTPDADDDCTNDGTGLEDFTSEMTDMYPGTKYYVRAYAENSVGRDYGEVKEFTTQYPDPPSVKTLDPTEVSYDSVVGNGEVLDTGGDPLTERGICWDSSTYPVYDNHSCQADSEQGDGTYDIKIEDLDMYESYFIRAYAKNSEGVDHGETYMIETTMVPPELKTNEVLDYDHESATVEGEIVDDGGGLDEYGVCWNTEGSPDINDNCSQSSDLEDGIFTADLTNLNSGTKYYVRAYAENDADVSYGEELSFTSTVEITVQIEGAGDITPTEGTHLYDKGDTFEASLTVDSDVGSFNSWTSQAGTFTDSSSETTTFTVPGEDTDVTANVDLKDYDLSGWSWSDGYGWIDFQPLEDYGVTWNINGVFEGWAWGDNIGWIKFHDLGNFPSVGPDYSVRQDKDGSLEYCDQGDICGWALACGDIEDCSHQDAQDKDWILFGANNEQGPIDLIDHPEGGYQLSGWAWSPKVGWISMNCENNDECESSDYRVLTEFNPESYQNEE